MELSIFHIKFPLSDMHALAKQGSTITKFPKNPSNKSSSLPTTKHSPRSQIFTQSFLYSPSEPTTSHHSWRARPRSCSSTNELRRLKPSRMHIFSFSLNETHARPTNMHNYIKSYLITMLLTNLSNISLIF